MNFISRIIKSINAMRERLKIERHEAMYGPHFNEECALKAVSKMENEDGSRGEHWSLEETTSIANQYGINLKGEKYNKYDKIDTLRAEKSALELGLSQSAQTANIVNQLRPCPVPAYLTCNPFGCNGGFTGYGYGYNDGCGCGC